MANEAALIVDVATHIARHKQFLNCKNFHLLYINLNISTINNKLIIRILRL